MSAPVDVLAADFFPGQRVKYGEFEAVIVRHYFETMWEIRVPGGITCVGQHELEVA